MTHSPPLERSNASRNSLIRLMRKVWQTRSLQWVRRLPSTCSDAPLSPSVTGMNAASLHSLWSHSIFNFPEVNWFLSLAVTEAENQPSSKCSPDFIHRRAEVLQ